MIRPLDIGYNKPLFILPFDHRSFFAKNIFGVDKDLITNEQKKEIKELKQIVYEGFKKAVLESIPKNYAAVLIDEEFGSDILRDAKEKKFNICLTVEKSGQKEFDFEYDESFGSHIEQFDPDFVKVLVRYNPEENLEINKRQLEKLKILNDYCHDNKRLFLFELLVPATKNQIELLGNNVLRFDEELRPKLTLKAIGEIREFKIEPDVWKIEGQDNVQSYKNIISEIRKGGENVGVVILGRGEDRGKVERWIAQSATTEGVTGFAIGRTIFWQPLLDYNNGKLTKEQAADKISKNYQYFYKLFMESRKE